MSNKDESNGCWFWMFVIGVMILMGAVGGCPSDHEIKEAEDARQRLHDLGYTDEDISKM